ncbi:MAG TPA: PSD1 and planctomycete cytochrome C domain-containing protein [Vicinamibacterales bacterium]|nr:PSD1 and planctomycete cytochrome C domain-containing protein [Vicinamibacterales bacterium]
MRTRWVAAAALPLMLSVAGEARQAAPAPAAAAQSAEFFESKVRPVLAANCYDCHTDQRMGGLRVDSREALLKGGRSGPAIVPGDPDKSLLIEAVRQTGKLKMPKGGELRPDEVAALVEWIRGGAQWAEAPRPTATAAAAAPAAKPAATASTYVIKPEQRAFWSFQPLHTPAAPAVSHQNWPKTDIDRFVLARLEKEGLTPVRAADKRTLIRRATLDLTGLPPTAEEIEAFEKDESPDAFAKIVDRLLASPQYGETWGRLWLDVARYGEDDYRSLDPKGRGLNPYPNAYLYRDWVIKAFNDDMPYDQFVRAQLAGDLLGDAASRARTLPALGFLGLGPWYYDNGAVEITRADERHDRVDVVSRGFLGLTVGCARCHDHKYDPIPTTDYYSLAGVFLDTTYKEYPLAPKSVVSEYDDNDKKIEKKEKLLDEFLRTESTQFGETLALQASKYMVAAWKVTGEPKEEMARVADAEKLDYELFDRWLKFLAKPPRFYPYLTKWQAMVKAGGTEKEARTLADEFQSLLLDVMFEKKEIKDENEIIAAKALPGTKKKEPGKLPSDFVTNDDFCPGCGLELKSLPVEKNNLWTDVFQRDLQDGFDPAQMFDRIKPGLLSFRGWGLERQLSGDRRRYIDGLRTDIEALRKAQPAKYPFVHGVGDIDTPINLKVSKRGSPYNLGDEVPRHFVSVLSDGAPAPFAKGSGRLELADAIVRHPISTRVIVNRIWKGHFGTGLVDSPSNFGVAGERPSNPELLEYLAQRFVDAKMSIKQLHRDIMLSAVYQLSADYDKQAFDKDGGNRWYWRFDRRRMTAEQLRDALLFVSGALDLKAGGPSVPLTPSVTRRTVYGKVSRYKLDEYLQLFDFPSPNLSAEKRFTTSVPLQRLFLMNSDFMQQQGELLARRIANEPDNTARIQKVYRLVFGRAPTDAEVKSGLAFIASEPLKAYEERKTAQKDAKDDGKDAKKAAAASDDDETSQKPDKDEVGMMAGVTPGSSKKDDPKLLPPSPWGRYIKILLSSNEFLFID